MIEITPIPAFKDNYIWMLTQPSTQFAVVVDPGDAQPVLMQLHNRQLELTAILITHHHWDHTGGIDALIEQYKVPVFGPAHETIPHLTHPLSENDTIELPMLNAHFKVLDIPGHTSGHIAYVGHNAVFCGDTLFAGGCGRLFEGTAKQMWLSLEKLSRLPANTQVFCAHEYTLANLEFALTVDSENPNLLRRYAEVVGKRQHDLITLPSTIELELATNPFLRCTTAQVLNSITQQSQTRPANSIEAFAALRALKDLYK